jgi:HrpA-like RNA helicase
MKCRGSWHVCSPAVYCTLPACSEDDEAKQRQAVEAAKLSKRERLRQQREALPAFAFKDDFVKAVFEHQILIIVAETGAGKTTQLPQYLLEAGFGEAGVQCNVSPCSA